MFSEGELTTEHMFFGEGVGNGASVLEVGANGQVFSGGSQRASFSEREKRWACVFGEGAIDGTSVFGEEETTEYVFSVKKLTTGKCFRRGS